MKKPQLLETIVFRREEKIPSIRLHQTLRVSQYKIRCSKLLWHFCKIGFNSQFLNIHPIIIIIIIFSRFTLLLIILSLHRVSGKNKSCTPFLSTVVNPDVKVGFQYMQIIRLVKITTLYKITMKKPSTNT